MRKSLLWAAFAAAMLLACASCTATAGAEAAHPQPYTATVISGGVEYPLDLHPTFFESKESIACFQYLHPEDIADIASSIPFSQDMEIILSPESEAALNKVAFYDASFAEIKYSSFNDPPQTAGEYYVIASTGWNVDGFRSGYQIYYKLIIA